LLAEAGFPSGLSIEYPRTSQYPELLKTGRVVRDELKIGVNMTIKAVDVSVWYDAFVGKLPDHERVPGAHHRSR
jgi:peptide/nickel transport system substrate-binding protein